MMGAKKPVEDFQIGMIPQILTGHCDLSHKGDPRGEQGKHTKAVNTLMIPMKRGHMMSFLVCELCWSELLKGENGGKDFDWYLFVCEKCCTAEWRHTSTTRRHYKGQIIGTARCENCYGQAKA